MMAITINTDFYTKNQWENSSLLFIIHVLNCMATSPTAIGKFAACSA